MPSRDQVIRVLDSYGMLLALLLANFMLLELVDDPIDRLQRPRTPLDRQPGPGKLSSRRTGMRRESMSRVDTAWLRMERATNLMMITSVMMFEEQMDLAQLKRLVEPDIRDDGM